MAATETCIGFIFRGARGRLRPNSLGPSGRTPRTFSGGTGERSKPSKRAPRRWPGSSEM